MELDKACKLIAKELDMDYDIVRHIVMFLFLFIVSVMKHETDTHDILLNKLFKFKLKRRFKENKQKEYSSK